MTVAFESLPARDPLDRIAFTVGHSTRPLGELVRLLESVDVEALVDVRSVPRSRRNPQFAADALGPALASHRIAYSHEASLGGFRRPRPGSPNHGWRHPAFVGYADYMASTEFSAALARFEELATARRACVMCAEAQWWRCHRRLIADALVVRSWRVLHLGLSASPIVHELTPFAIVASASPGAAASGPTLTYPPAQRELELDERSQA